MVTGTPLTLHGKNSNNEEQCARYRIVALAVIFENSHPAPENGQKANGEKNMRKRYWRRRRRRRGL